MRHARRSSGRRQRGVAAVEFGLIAVFFFTVLLSIIDWSYLFFANLTMQHAVREGARYAAVGRTDLAPGGSSNPRCDAVRAKIRQQSWGFFDRWNSSSSFYTLPAIGATPVRIDSGCYGANQVIIVEVSSEVEPLTPFLRPFFPDTGGRYAFTVAATMKNEAWQ